MNPVFQEVDQVLWVVDDLGKVMKGWQKIGFSEMTSYKKKEMIIKGEAKEKMTANIGMGYLGGLKAFWMQPIKGENVFSTSLGDQGDGAIALIHRVKSGEVLTKIIKKMEEQGINVSVEFAMKSEKSMVEYTLMDTKIGGTYYLGFVLGGESGYTEKTGKNTLQMKFNQYAFAVADPGPVSDFWTSLDFPAFEITHGAVHDKMYYGKASDFDMKLGWQRHGSVVYEWCIPLKPPTVYADHISKRGPGIQHFGFAVPDMDRAIDHFESHGYSISMSGGWGEKGKPGSGRFAYVDLNKIGGMTVELLWNYRE
jgi:hypothetical protein